jgi:hypothetical protein
MCHACRLFFPLTPSPLPHSSLTDNNNTSAEVLEAEVTLLTQHYLRIALRCPALHWRASQPEHALERLLNPCFFFFFLNLTASQL